jgi:hypothetical protein
MGSHMNLKAAIHGEMIGMLEKPTPGTSTYLSVLMYERVNMKNRRIKMYP